MNEKDDLLRAAREAYERARDWWYENHREAREDLAFARLGKQ